MAGPAARAEGAFARAQMILNEVPPGDSFRVRLEAELAIARDATAAMTVEGDEAHAEIIQLRGHRAVVRTALETFTTAVGPALGDAARITPSQAAWETAAAAAPLVAGLLGTAYWTGWKWGESMGYVSSATNLLEWVKGSGAAIGRYVCKKFRSRRG